MANFWCGTQCLALHMSSASPLAMWRCIRRRMFSCNISHIFPFYRRCPRWRAAENKRCPCWSIAIAIPVRKPSRMRASPARLIYPDILIIPTEMAWRIARNFWILGKVLALEWRTHEALTIDWLWVLLSLNFIMNSVTVITEFLKIIWAFI